MKVLKDLEQQVYDGKKFATKNVLWLIDIAVEAEGLAVLVDTDDGVDAASKNSARKILAMLDAGPSKHLEAVYELKRQSKR